MKPQFCVRHCFAQESIEKEQEHILSLYEFSVGQIPDMHLKHFITMSEG